ncbi:MAG: 6-phosphogluconolactonase [Anaeromyxobacteraceae bacterium]
MRIEVLTDEASAALAAARWLADEARAAVAARGRFTLAVSGGRTPWSMLRALSTEEVPWSAVHLLQVDERVAPAGSPDRNFTHVAESLLARVKLPPGNVHAMPVEEADLGRAAAAYARELAVATGGTGALDVVHLGLGLDGHTASLPPGDPDPERGGGDVVITGPYAGWRRMTLTRGVIDRARRILWLVTGAGKAPMLARLAARDPTIPAGRVDDARAIAFVDAAAASLVPRRPPQEGTWP